MNFGIDGATSKRASGPPVWFAHSGVGGFQVVDERYIRDDYLKNVTFLRDYRSYPSDGKSALMLLQTLQELQVSTPSELLAATFMDLTNRMQAVGAMWRMVANGSIGANLRQRLTMKSEIWYEEPTLYGK